MRDRQGCPPSCRGRPRGSQRPGDRPALHADPDRPPVQGRPAASAPMTDPSIRGSLVPASGSALVRSGSSGVRSCGDSRRSWIGGSCAPNHRDLRPAVPSIAAVNCPAFVTQPEERRWRGGVGAACALNQLLEGEPCREVDDRQRQAITPWARVDGWRPVGRELEMVATIGHDSTPGGPRGRGVLAPDAVEEQDSVVQPAEANRARLTHDPCAAEEWPSGGHKV